MHATYAPRVEGSDWHELDGRENDGLEVSLLWNRSDGRTKVVVSDRKCSHEFELDVASADALAAFHHPFAFAARRGLSFGVVQQREPIHLQPQS